jgi:hypothetical protein
MRTDRRTDGGQTDEGTGMVKLRVAFRTFANTPKICGRAIVIDILGGVQYIGYVKQRFRTYINPRKLLSQVLVILS